jgi:rare lipoprotein A
MISRKTIFITLFCVSIFSGCTTSLVPLQTTDYETIKKVKSTQKQPKRTSRARINFQEFGLASYYGQRWDGKTTANGEKLNLRELTAAHKSLPFNSIVKVTDLDTGKSIIVRINDRGPYVRGRIIDLTDSAAKKLGILHKGIAKVKIEVLS